MDADPSPLDFGRRFLAYILIAAGGLVVLLSGACTLTWLGFMTISIAKSPASAPAAILPVLFLTLSFGGLPMAAGVAMIIGGRSMLKKPKLRLKVF